MCEKTNMPPTGPQLVHAIKRNFGGLEESGVNPETVFLSRLRINIDEAPDLSDIDPEVSTDTTCYKHGANKEICYTVVTRYIDIFISGMMSLCIRCMVARVVV